LLWLSELVVRDRPLSAVSRWLFDLKCVVPSSGRPRTGSGDIPSSRVANFPAESMELNVCGVVTGLLDAGLYVLGIVLWSLEAELYVCGVVSWPWDPLSSPLAVGSLVVSMEPSFGGVCVSLPEVGLRCLLNVGEARGPDHHTGRTRQFLLCALGRNRRLKTPLNPSLNLNLHDGGVL
jgi:hypothetical protein